MASKVDCYWAQFLDSIPAGQAKPNRYVESFFFGTRPDSAHEITRLVLDGTKTATGDLLWSAEADGRHPARQDDCWVVTNGGGDPACIIQTFDVRIIPFDEVEEEYALWGGEGDRTMDSWRDMYWSFIVSECKRIGRTANLKAPLIMDRFRVVYAEPLQAR